MTLKNIIITVFLIFPIFLQAQEKYFPVNPVTGKIEYTRIIECKKPKEIIYRNAKTWLSSESVLRNDNAYTPKIIMEDISTGRIIANFCHLEINEFTETDTSFKVTIDCRTDKYRISIEDYYYSFNMKGISEHSNTFLDWKNMITKNESIEDVKNALLLHQFIENIISTSELKICNDDDF